MQGAATVLVDNPTDWVSIFNEAKAGNFVDYLPRQIDYEDDKDIEFKAPSESIDND